MKLLSLKTEHLLVEDNTVGTYKETLEILNTQAEKISYNQENEESLKYIIQKLINKIK